MKPFLLPLLTCSLLAACGTGGGTPGSGGFTVSGSVLLPPDKLEVASLPFRGSGSTDWSLPHVGGEVLIAGQDLPATLPGSLGALNLQETGSAGLRRVQTPAGESDQAFAARLSQALSAQGLTAQSVGTPGGFVVQPNYIYRALSVPNDPGYPVNAGVEVGGKLYDQDYLTRINAQTGWDALQAAGLTPVGAVTAVLDTGVDRSHPDLQGRLLDGYDFAGNDADPSEATGGDVGHGTSSAGLIGATGNNKLGITGLTWSGKNILPVKVFDDAGGATTADLSKAVNYAVTQGARVINMSLGMTGQNTDTVLKQSLQSAANAGVVLVAAAGNTANDGLYFPASDPNVLAVGALGKTDDLACYSARPKTSDKALDLVAPGGNAVQSGGSCAGDLDYGILSLAPVTQTTSGSARVQAGYGLRIGTSESAPLVSGAAALIRGARPDLKGAQVKSLLTGSAKTVSGGKLLDVGAAVKAALALPLNPARAYTLTVSGGGVTQTFKSSLAAGSGSIPFSLSGVPAGATTLNASLTISGQTYTGSVNVNVTGDLTGQTIQTH